MTRLPWRFIPDIPVEVEALPEEDPAAGEIADAEPATYDDPDDLQGGDALDATGAEDDDPDPMDAGDAGPDGVITQIVEGVPHEDAFGLDLLLINDVDPDETEPEEPEDEGPEEEDDLTCFVATAAFRDHAHPDVVFLRRFRDEKLTASAAGRLFISAYWTMGPILAVPVRRSDSLAAASRKVIGLIVSVLRRLI